MSEILPAFSRARIAQLCDAALRRSGVLGVLPTPVEAVLEAAGAVTHAEAPASPGPRVLGAVWLEERAVFVDAHQSAPRRRFTAPHEATHLLCPWHAAALRLDTVSELFGELARGVEAEANYGAGQLIFQGGSFARAARSHDASLVTAYALAAAYGASRHAAAHHYVETHEAPVAMAVAGRWPGRDGTLPVWRTVESPPFLRRFGRLAGCLPGRALAASDGPLAAAIDAARRSSAPVAAALGLPDRAGRARRVHAEVANNRHCHLVFVAELPARSCRAAA